MPAPCRICDDKGWVCQAHPDRPFAFFSSRADACQCGDLGTPCICNPDPINDRRCGKTFIEADWKPPPKPTVH